ncbi:MAG: hypothetical protein HC875_33110, partial [Anaerolineales bacterium]|nr:hypothetical protein [Anaerolineales bacterium]
MTGRSGPKNSKLRRLKLSNIVAIQSIAQHVGEEVTIQGWLYARTDKGKLQFLQVRDGTGTMQAVLFRGNVPDERLAQMLDHFTQYVGSSPEQSPAILCAIAHMQTDRGVWYPMGGTGAVPKALRKLGGELGVNFVNGVQVRRILRENGRVVGVETKEGSRFEADAVISNMDALRTYRELVGGTEAQRFESRRSFEPACSGVVLYLGLKQRYE